MTQQQAAADQNGKLSELDKRIAAAARAKISIEARDDYLKFVKFTMPDIEEPDNVQLSIRSAMRAFTGRWPRCWRTSRKG